jgi:hypothetical protein
MHGSRLGLRWWIAKSFYKDHHASTESEFFSPPGYKKGETRYVFVMGLQPIGDIPGPWHFRFFSSAWCERPARHPPGPGIAHPLGCFALGLASGPFLPRSNSGLSTTPGSAKRRGELVAILSCYWPKAKMPGFGAG